MDMNARSRLLERAYGILDEGNTLLAVSVAEFFNGNTDEQSIGVNLPKEEHIGLAGFRRTLEVIERRPDVQGVFLELTEIPEVDEPEDDDLWPIACVAFIVTSATVDEVRTWVEQLRPRSVDEGWCVAAGVKVPIPQPELGPGMRPVRVWLL